MNPMGPRNDIREFLVSRRVKIAPEQAGLPAYGISAEYYVRLERGNMRGVSEDVLDGIARALQLDEAGRMHLFDLARAANATPNRRTARRPTQERVRPVVQRILDANPGQVAAYRGGKEGLLGFFVGQVMKETQGKANAKVVNERIREKLGAS